MRSLAICRRYIAVFFVLFACPAFAQTASQQPAPPADPFGDLAPAAQASPTPAQEPRQPHGFFSDNFAFKKELMSEIDTDADGSNASRQSVGFEILKKFSTSTATVASFDFQWRLVRRDGYNPVPNDMEGATRPGWASEYHNLYVDLYNVFNPLMSEDARARRLGKFNFRVGRFYLPFGLNLQTDTHGTLLQLSNGTNFGFERDWYAGFWGALNKHLNYDLYYLAGSGYDLKFKGQSGLAAARLSLANKYSAEHGLEGGFSVIGGQRLSASSIPLATRRVGVDARYRHPAPRGLLTFTTELSGGRDAATPVTVQLAQAEYLRASRRWSVASQFRRVTPDRLDDSTAFIGEFTWFFRNDVANTNSHWIKLNVERRIQGMTGRPHTIVTLQYYLYL